MSIPTDPRQGIPTLPERKTPKQRSEDLTANAVGLVVLAFAAALALIVIAAGYRCAAALAGWD